MKKTVFIAAVSAAVMALSAFSCPAWAGFVKEGGTPLIDTNNGMYLTVSGNKYYTPDGKPANGLVYYDVNHNMTGYSMRMHRFDNGKRTGFYSGFTKDKKGKRLYALSQRVYGWYKYKNNWYHADPGTGYLSVGKVTIAGAEYEFDKNGKWTGYVSDEGRLPNGETFSFKSRESSAGFDTDGNLCYGKAEKDGSLCSRKITLPDKDRQAVYAIFREWGFAEGTEQLDYDYKYIEKILTEYMKDASGGNETDLMMTEPAEHLTASSSQGIDVTVLMDITQIIHIDSEALRAYRLTKSLNDYYMQSLLEKYPYNGENALMTFE